MSKLSSSFLLICAFSLIEAQKCSGVLKVPLQDKIIVGAVTPVDENGKLNYAIIPRIAQYYKNNNFKVVYIAGYFGEAPSVPLAERKRLVEVWEEQTNSLGLDLVVEIGAMPYVDTLELAHHCSKLNITAITAFAEVTYQATTLDEALEDLQRICDASSNIPLLYHELNGVNQNIRTEQIFLGAKDGCVTCFVGALTSVNTFLDMKAAVDSIDGYQFWEPRVQSIAAALKVGMNATQTTNLFPDLTWKIRDAVNNCQLEQSEALQQELNRRMYAITNVNGGPIDPPSRTYIEQSKAAFELLSGIEIGNRYPLEDPNSTVIDQIRSNLQGRGVRLYSSDKKN